MNPSTCLFCLLHEAVPLHLFWLQVYFSLLSFNLHALYFMFADFLLGVIVIIKFLVCRLVCWIPWMCVASVIILT